MFNHAHHQRILHVLESLNESMFSQFGALFGGGTLITLLNQEYRWSKDIDFVCPTGIGYKQLRKVVFDANFDPGVLFSKTASLKFPRQLKADQYGVRFLIVADNEPIKFEIIAEQRIALDPAEKIEGIPVPCLSLVDRWAEKLLANADRGLDSSVESRDLIDLAVLRLKGAPPEFAIEKAEAAYPVLDPLRISLEKFQQSPQYREKCFSVLEINCQPAILDGIDFLAEDLGMGKTVRTSKESNS